MPFERGFSAFFRPYPLTLIKIIIRKMLGLISFIILLVASHCSGKSAEKGVAVTNRSLMKSSDFSFLVLFFLSGSSPSRLNASVNFAWLRHSAFDFSPSNWNWNLTHPHNTAAWSVTGEASVVRGAALRPHASKESTLPLEPSCYTT